MIEIHYYLCDSERVLGVRLEDVSDTGGEADNPVLWSITSDQGSDQQMTYVVGSRPDGFEEAVALSSEFDDASSLLAVIETAPRLGPSFEFSPADLSAGRILVQGDPDVTVDPEEFQERGQQSCA